MALSDLACRNAKPEPRPRKLSDSGGLFLLVTPAGGKLWRWKYSFAGSEKLLALGKWPAVPLAQARKLRDAARALKDAGTDPAFAKRQRKAEALADAYDNFERVARAWHAQWQRTRSSRYAMAVLARIETNLLPRLGKLPLRSIDAPMVLAAIRTIEARGAHQMAHKVQNHAVEIFDWAQSSGLCQANPARVIRKALAPHDPRLRPAAIRIEAARDVLARTEALAGAHCSTLLASRMLALTATRPGNVRLAELHEFEDLDGPAPLWRIPAAKMKLVEARKRDAAYEFLVPLSAQAAATARAAISVSAACQAQHASRRWLFPGIGNWTRPISDSTLSALYRDAGLRGAHVPHGWRSSFSTIMNERAAMLDSDGDRAMIDHMLAHRQPGVEPVYNRSAYLPRRRALAQAWADLLLDAMAGPESLLPDVRPWRKQPPG